MEKKRNTNQDVLRDESIQRSTHERDTNKTQKTQTFYLYIVPFVYQIKYID